MVFHISPWWQLRAEYISNFSKLCALQTASIWKRCTMTCFEIPEPWNILTNTSVCIIRNNFYPTYLMETAPECIPFNRKIMIETIILPISGKSLNNIFFMYNLGHIISGLVTFFALFHTTSRIAGSFYIYIYIYIYIYNSQVRVSSGNLVPSPSYPVLLQKSIYCHSELADRD